MLHLQKRRTDQSQSDDERCFCVVSMKEVVAHPDALGDRSDDDEHHQNRQHNSYRAQPKMLREQFIWPLMGR